MTYYVPRSSYEPEWSPYTEVAADRAVRLAVGQQLGTRYKVPRDLPHEMLTLVMQLNEREE
jgi:hypothetical protein